MLNYICGILRNCYPWLQLLLHIAFSVFNNPIGPKISVPGLLVKLPVSNQVEATNFFGGGCWHFPVIQNLL